MEKQTGEVKYIPYRQDGEPARRAAITNVDFPLDNLSDNDIQILGHLMEASEAMNPIFRYQFEKKTFIIRPLIECLKCVAESETKEKLDNYLTMLDLQNSPYALLPRKNHLLEVPVEELQALAKKAKGDCTQRLGAVLDLLTTGKETPDLANFYPSDITDDEFKSLGKHAVNSKVIRDEDGNIKAELNERRYRAQLKPAIKHLRAARNLASDLGLRLYLDAKISEMELGTEEARRIADYLWVRHNSPIDIVISTALEVYLDNYKNARGAACAGVYVKNNAAEELLKSLVSHVPAWEAEAPWDHKKSNIDPETLPKLKFVDVLNWAGDYVSGPFTTIAQSLPNDEWVIQNVGTVNMVYMNTGRAVHRVAGELSAEEFLTKDNFDTIKDILFDANQLHSALHEIGHTTGKLAPEHDGTFPQALLQEEYSYLEETRAELFGLWSLKKLFEDGVVDEKMVNACYAGMIIAMITSLKFDPVQAHNKARNGMFHWFEEKGVLSRIEEDGKTKFTYDMSIAHDVVADMLGVVGNIKANGQKDKAIELREKYVYTDDFKAEVEKRTATFPLGRGLIFPRLKKDENGKYLREVEYAENFSDQVKFNLDMSAI